VTLGRVHFLPAHPTASVTSTLSLHDALPILTDVETARRILAEEAGFSPAMVKQEIDRYTFRAPGQAGSYFYGYSQLADLRVATELALGDKFDRIAFNDFIVGQGLLPIGLLAQAVREKFVPAMLAK